MQPGFHGSCGGWDLCEKSLIYRDDLTGKLLLGKGRQTCPSYLAEAVIIIGF